jgi:hypothetical protein
VINIQATVGALQRIIKNNPFLIVPGAAYRKRVRASPPLTERLYCEIRPS